MNERLLCKCPNNIVAHKVVSILTNDDIVFRQHDETNDPRIGAYGPTPGIAIYVFEKDYEKAQMLIEPIVNSSTKSIKPFCPKCGSEDTSRIEKNKFMIPLLILSIVLFIAPVAYFYFTKDLENHSMTLDILAIIAFLSSIVMAFLCDRKTANYKCNGCGKKFNRI
ncbi:DUF2007 domain-containing protein [uncultured Bacteroides sp.]|uniref:putative signal transducing protein n=1 Tax=uncultured Bacteroides sp. TaxID=162156 RepID=UPI00267074A6|nr:DUF2007 domain-containing protein [uncultured Bacteroides sp.]MCX4336459.1 DUF2007 domain-containing protein [Bacteroidales bacterium]